MCQFGRGWKSDGIKAAFRWSIVIRASQVREDLILIP